jgi:hexosaminidase
MKKILISLAVLSVLFSCAEKQKDTEISILPQPQAIRVDEGVFEVDKATKIYMDSCTDEMKRVAGFINEKFAKAAGFELEIVDRMPEENFIAFMNAGMPTESYVINAKPHGVFIDYGDGAGAFYAVQTLFQLLPTEIYAQERQKGIDWTVPCCSIDDAPRFKYRGMHLDVCLHYFDFEFLKRYIDIMAAHKVNRFHWHLTEDQGWRIEIKKYPLLTEKGQWRKETVVGSLFSGVYDGIPHGGYYTQEQVKELVQYAAERYVTIIPEIELPGHALAAIACYPELSCGLEDHYETATKWGVFKQVYCTKESTFKFLEDVFDEVFELFPSELIHIGGD